MAAVNSVQQQSHPHTHGHPPATHKPSPASPPSSTNPTTASAAAGGAPTQGRIIRGRDHHKFPLGPGSSPARSRDPSSSSVGSNRSYSYSGHSSSRPSSSYGAPAASYSHHNM